MHFFYNSTLFHFQFLVISIFWLLYFTHKYLTSNLRISWGKSIDRIAIQLYIDRSTMAGWLAFNFYDNQLKSCLFDLFAGWFSKCKRITCEIRIESRIEMVGQSIQKDYYQCDFRSLKYESAILYLKHIVKQLWTIYLDSFPWRCWRLHGCIIMDFVLFCFVNLNYRMNHATNVILQHWLCAKMSVSHNEWYMNKYKHTHTHTWELSYTIGLSKMATSCFISVNPSCFMQNYTKVFVWVLQMERK